MHEISLIKKVKNSFWETLCHFKRICGKNRQVKLRKKAADRLTKHLDIRSFASVETNVALLLSLLLTDKQRLLFKHNALRVLRDSTKSGTSGEDVLSDFHLVAPKKKF